MKNSSKVSKFILPIFGLVLFCLIGLPQTSFAQQTKTETLKPTETKTAKDGLIRSTRPRPGAPSRFTQQKTRPRVGSTPRSPHQSTNRHSTRDRRASSMRRGTTSGTSTRSVSEEARKAAERSKNLKLVRNKNVIKKTGNR